MSTGRPPAGTIPTLTEVVSWPGEAPAAPDVEVEVDAPAETPVPAAKPAAPPIALAVPPAPAVTPPAAAPSTRGAPAPRAAASAGDVQQAQRLLAELQRQVELMLEVRLREALAPVLARAADALVRDARKELTAAMRDIVSKSIARELGRREDR